MQQNRTITLPELAMNLALYAAVVLIWGTTWIAIKMQVGLVPIPYSIAWRFALAAAVMFAWLALRGRLRVPAAGTRGLIAVQGLCLFCVNFLCFYHASRFIPSGLESVVFSTAPLWNALNGRLWFGRKVAANVLAGGVLGLAGLVLLFYPEFGRTDAGTGLGLLLALGGTLCFSAGNMLSGLLQARGVRPADSNPWAMLAGTLAMLAGAVAAGLAPDIDLHPAYLGALVYLAVPGSVLGFTFYLMLVGRMGADKAAYCTVLFPLVSLNISVWLEGYAWTLPACAGLALVMLGNVLVFWRGGWPRLWRLRPSH